VLHALVDVAEEPLELAPAQRLHRDDRAVLGELTLGRREHLVLDAGPPVQLHRALHEEGGAGVDGGARVPLDDQVGHPVAGKEQRHRQADEAPADDQYRYLVLPHGSRSYSTA
jgi:hypothetical protein